MHSGNVFVIISQNISKYHGRLLSFNIFHQHIIHQNKDAVWTQKIRMVNHPNSPVVPQNASWGCRSCTDSNSYSPGVVSRWCMRSKMIARIFVEIWIITTHIYIYIWIHGNIYIYKHTFTIMLYIAHIYNLYAQIKRNVTQLHACCWCAIIKLA